MERALLQKILENTQGVDQADGAFVCADDHKASIYLALRGTTNVLADVVRVQLHDDYVEAETKNDTTHCVAYEPVMGLTIHRPPKESGRTGF